MLSFFKVRKWLGFVLAGAIPVVFFVVIIISMGDLFLATVFVFVGLILSVILGSLFVKHPFMEMLEGKGLLTLTFDSTGTIEMFTVAVDPPYIKGFYRNREINGTYDRDMVTYLCVPKKGTLCNAVEIDEDGNKVGECQVLKMPKVEDKPKYLFSFGTYPCFIYNKILGVFLSKDVLASNEKDTMIKHVILYLLRKTEDLTNSIRDFARHVVEQTRPKKGLFENKKWLLYLIIIVVVIMLIALVAPTIMESIAPVAQENPFPPTTIPLIKSYLFR